MAENIVVYGASSAIVCSTLRQFAKKSCHFVLIARRMSRLEKVKADLKTRGAQKVELIEADLNDTNLHDDIWAQAQASLGTVDRVILGFGSLGDQSQGEHDYGLAEAEIRTNFLSYVSILTPIANHMEAAGAGQIVAISSVAGDRGRQSNYIYGSAKAALSAYLSGLRQRLGKSGVSVVTVKPGFVDTPMTAHVAKNPLFASPDRVGADIHRAMMKNQSVLYTPGFWRLIMLVIRLIPEFVFKRLSL